jgi:hypothetical protein
VLSLNPDILLVHGGINDSGTNAQFQAAMVSFLAAVRAVNKTIPVIVLGSNSYSATNRTSVEIPREQAFAAGVGQFGDPSVVFVPMLTATEGAYFTGTGTSVAPNGSGNADVYISSTNHPLATGHLFYARRLADKLRAVIQSATWA